MKTAESHQVVQDNSALDHRWQLVLWCSLMSVRLFYTLMVEVKDIGVIIDRQYS